MTCQDATAKFQALQRIYEVLSDEERRKLYDETGCIDGGGDEDTIAQFYSFFRQQFKEVEAPCKPQSPAPPPCPTLKQTSSAFDRGRRFCFLLVAEFGPPCVVCLSV